MFTLEDGLFANNYYWLHFRKYSTADRRQMKQGYMCFAWNYLVYLKIWRKPQCKYYKSSEITTYIF